MLKAAREEKIREFDVVNFGYDYQGVDIPTEYNRKIASGQWRSEVFPAGRWYQLMKIPLVLKYSRLASHDIGQTLYIKNKKLAVI